MIPSILPTYNRAPLSFVKGEGSWLIEADGRRYLVRFLEHALKDDVAPFSAVREEVVDMILHRRQQELLLAMEEQLVIQAWADGDVEKFN